MILWGAGLRRPCQSTFLRQQSVRMCKRSWGSRWLRPGHQRRFERAPANSAFPPISRRIAVSEQTTFRAKRVTSHCVKTEAFSPSDHLKVGHRPANWGVISFSKFQRVTPVGWVRRRSTSCPTRPPSNLDQNKMSTCSIIWTCTQSARALDRRATSRPSPCRRP